MQDSHGKVSVEAFELYFKFVSACYLEENVFQFMMWNVWDLHQVRAGGQVAGVGLGKVRKSHPIQYMLWTHKMLVHAATCTVAIGHETNPFLH